MKKFIDKFFYLEDEEDYDASEGVASHVEKKADKQRPTKQPQAVQPVQPIHAQQFAAQQQQQQQQASTRFKRGRTQQQPVNEVDKMTNNVVSLQAATSSKNAKVVLVEPRVYAEAQDIAENIKNKRATIVNLQRIEHDQGVRIIDFLSGTVYALGGDIQRVGTNIFLCTPENVEVSGEISDYIDI